MATNKTIAPTGVTVQIPALTDTPDMSVPANAIDKAIDGINTLNSKIANIGTQTADQTGTVSVPSGVRTKIAEKTLNAGRYVVVRGIDWAQNATGRRTVNRSDSSARHNYVTQMAVTGDDTVIQMVTTEAFDTETTIEIWGLQDSGTALTAYPYWYIMQIK